MCGIFGFVTPEPKKENAEVFRRLMYNSRLRGRDATGLLCVDKEGNITTHKAPLDAENYDKVHMHKFMEPLGKAVLAFGHVRAATMGSEKDNVNNHPVESEHYYAIHNGMLHSLPKLKDYKYQGEVDTEIFLSYVETEGMEKAMPWLGYGSGSFVILEKKNPHKIFITRYVSPVYLGFRPHRKMIIFASDDDIIFNSIPKFLNSGGFNGFPDGTVLRMKDEVMYEISVNPIEIKELFTYKTKSRYFYGAGHGYIGGHGWNGWDGYSEGEHWRDRYNRNTDKDKNKDESNTTQLLDPKTDEEYGYYFDPDIQAWLDYQEFPFTEKHNKFWFDGNSKDFNDWVKLTSGKGYVSTDRQLAKKWDQEAKKHFLMDIDDAIAEGEIGLVQGYSYQRRETTFIRAYLDHRDNIIAITLAPDDDKMPKELEGYDFIGIDDVEIVFTIKHGKTKVEDEIMRFDFTNVDEIEQRVLESVYERDKQEGKDTVDQAKQEVKNLPVPVEGNASNTNKNVGSNRQSADKFDKFGDRAYVCGEYEPFNVMLKYKRHSCLYCQKHDECVKQVESEGHAG